MDIVNGLLIVVVLLSGLSLYFWLRLKNVESTEDVQPLDTGFIAWVALVFVFFIVALFTYFGDNAPRIPQDVGQIGDFVGGLTNPVLSFLALLVLLRTTRIQTLESRKTTEFMREQHKLMEAERFEGTFFHLLAQLEDHCEKHFRPLIDGNSYGKTVAARLRGKYKEFGELPKDEQLKAAQAHIKPLVDNVNCIILYQRAMRVVRFVNNSKLPRGTRASYAAIFRDTIYPNECLIITSSAWGNVHNSTMLKDWKVVDLGRGSFPCPEIEYYYFGPPKPPIDNVQAAPKDRSLAPTPPSAEG